MQIMPKTYKTVRGAFPNLGLPRNGRVGSCGEHIDAVLLAYLVLDLKLAAMPQEYQRMFLKNPQTCDEFVAASYNGGEKRGSRLFREMPVEEIHEVVNHPEFYSRLRRKKFPEAQIIPRETWGFLRKYIAIHDHISALTF